MKIKVTRVRGQLWEVFCPRCRSQSHWFNWSSAFSAAAHHARHWHPRTW